MHFYQLSQEISNLSNTPKLVALHPHFDISYDVATMQRDIGEVSFWKYANPVPFIIPPVLNKESYLSLDYSKAIMTQMILALSEAELIFSLGFSIPRLDLHINAFFQLVSEASTKNNNKKIGLVYKSSSSDQTFSNWTRIFGKQNISVINDHGIPLSSVDELNDMWDKINRLVIGE